MGQQGLNFSRDVNLPTAGLTPQSRHASSTGAQCAARDRGALSVAYLDLLKAVAPRGLSDFEAALALGRMVSSICSTRNRLGDLVMPQGSFQVSEFGTRRCRYTVRSTTR